MKKRILSLLVLLVTAVTGAWAQTETLLTTITATGKDSYSETTPGVVTVTHDNDQFSEDFGWKWGAQAGSLTVKAKDGYTITKCVFSQPFDKTVTVSTSPFKVNFVYNDEYNSYICEGSNPDEGTMDGVLSIEVYGYASYSVALKSSTEDAANWQGKAGTGDYQSLPLTGLEASTAVSVKYSGTKMVKSVKARKKAPIYTLLSAVTTEDVGKVVCAAGHLHPAKTAVPAGCTAVGILGKVTETGHGLILALENASDQNWNTINGWPSETTYAGTTLKVLPDDAARGSLTSYTALGTTAVSNWAVAQKSDYEAIFINLGSEADDYGDGKTYDDNVNAYITGAGGTTLSNAYCSATEAGNNVWNFESGFWSYDNKKDDNNKVRPVLGFGGEAVEPAAKTDLLSGVFSVSASKKVNFSKGNLRYASSKWSFFDNQYDYYTSYSADAWDKFGWSTSATTYGMNTSNDNATYSGDFVDWGATMGTGWFTLSSDEWTYLFNTRSASTVGGTADGRYAKAKVNDVQGIILFPDTYTHPDGVTPPTGVNAEDVTGWNGNDYSSADWTKMESAGCVFLPAAGCRNGSSVNYPGAGGYYWSATPNGTDYAYSVYFSSDYLYPATYGSRFRGCSVRLVQATSDAAPATPALSITSPSVGQVIGSDGKNYAYGSLPTGVTAVAKICYVSGSNGLALALTDEGDAMNWRPAIETIAAHTAPFTGGTWKLATKDEWSNMITAAGSYTALRDGFSSVGGTNMQSNYYWSSTVWDSNGAWSYDFSNGYWVDDNMDFDSFVRACLAFTVEQGGAAYTLLSAATTSDCGKVVCAAGHLHDAKTAVPAGCTAVGILGKVTETGHGLILALKNATSQNWNTINGWTSVTTYAGTTLKVLPDDAARGTNLTSYTALGETAVSNWAVAQKSDYEAIFENLGSTTGDDDGMTYDGNVNAYITTGVVGDAISGYYWSATESSSGSAWIFVSDCWGPGGKTESYTVRPVLGFGGEATPATTDLSTITENYEAKNGETLTGTLTNNVKISIADGATVTLKNVNITNLGDDCDWAGINCPGDATLVLEGTNEVCAGKGDYGFINYPGIWIAPNKTLTIQGAGNLTAYSGGPYPDYPYGAGIGGGFKISCGNIVINSGTITATGGYDAAGIGIGGGDGSCGNITINGGTITATGDGGGAGIGGGYGNACGNITISGGTVSATGGYYAAGIGGGRSNGACGTITIKSTVTSVTATKGSVAPNSIGSGGENGTAITVTIEDGANVTQN